jgi:hypothetical protein
MDLETFSNFSLPTLVGAFLKNLNKFTGYN